MLQFNALIFLLLRSFTLIGVEGGARQRWDSTKTAVSAISGTEVGQGSKPV